MYCVPIMVKNACVGMVGFDAVNKLYDFNDYEKNLLAVFAQLIANIEERKENHTLINETLKELNGVYLLSQLNAEMGICLSDYFKRTCEIICHSFFIPSQTYVAISYLNEQYFSSNFIATKKSIEKELILPNQTKIGNLCICIPEENNFLESEIEFVNNVARLILQKYNKDLFEESLLKSEEKYRIIAENNYNWEFWEGPDGTFLYHSPACLQVTGYTAEELLADQVLCHTLIHPKDIKGFGMHQEYVLLNKEPGKHNFRLVAKNGEVKYIEHVCKPVYANDGTFLGTRGSNIVVTEKVEAFNKLSKSEQRLNNLLNSQTSYVLRTDLLGRHTFWNKAFEEAFGWMYKEKGLTEADSLTSICDYDKPKAAEVVSKCFKNPGKIFKVQLDKPSKDGSIVNTAWDFVCITDDAGKPFEIQCIGIDVTESVRAIKKLQENEQWLGSLLNSQTSFVLRTDMQGRHTYWNHSFEEKFGWIYENGLNHENSLKSICTHHHQRTLETVNECISNPGKIAKVELDKPGKDGDIVTTLWEFVCLASELGEPIEIQCMGIDITDRRKSEEIILDLNQNLEQKVLDRTEELNKTNKELELAKLAADTANQEKSLFLSRMSHELRTPMNSILGFAQILEMATLDERQKRGVGHIIKSGNHLLNLINEVLDIARIESGKVSLSLESVALNAVVAEVLDLTAPAADTRKINIDFAPAIDFHVVADKQRLKQVLINVVNNAIKYNSVGGKVWIETKQEGDYVKVLINDNGFGIKSENLTKLFVPFERLGAEKHQIEGTGLGLSVVKQLMHSMQGKMGVESVYGGGSTFWLSFKIAKNQNQIIEDLSHDISEIANYENEGPNQGKLMHTILYIEDNISNIELVETILQNTRPELNLVTDTYGRNAVALAKLHKPKLILLDLNLPDMHGSEVLDTLKLDGEVNDIPVVVLSADAMEKQVKYMLDLGAVKYITKPFQIKEFVDLIDVYCK
jgi:PAS domain S-box-containing protein